MQPCWPRKPPSPGPVLKASLATNIGKRRQAVSAEVIFGGDSWEILPPFWKDDPPSERGTKNLNGSIRSHDG